MYKYSTLKGLFSNLTELFGENLIKIQFSPGIYKQKHSIIYIL